MAWFKKNSPKPTMTRTEAMACRPMKNMEVTEERLENDVVLLRYPVRIRPWMAAVSKRLGADPNRSSYRKLQLDVLGTEVWDLLDGRRTVGNLIERFAETHRLQHREAEVSVTRFLRELGRRGLIGLG